MESLAPGTLNEGALVTPELVDDPFLEPPPPALQADFVARIGSDRLLHVECQGYRDPKFLERVFRYHLTLALRYFPRRVETVAIWLVRPSQAQRLGVIEIGNITVRITPIVLAEADARVLLANPLTACFAPGADAGAMSSTELCNEVARILAENNASHRQRHMAAITAAKQGRFEEMVNAMAERNLGPVIIEDLVDFGHEKGLEQGLKQGLEQGLERGLAGAKASLLDVLAHRGFTPGAGHRQLVESERSLEALREWLRRALAAATVDEIFAPRRVD